METTPMVMTAGYLMELICDPSIAVADVIEVLGGELTPANVRAIRAGDARITGDSAAGFVLETRGTADRKTGDFTPGAE